MKFYVLLQKILDEQGISVAEAARTCKIPLSTLTSILRRKGETTTLEIALKLSEGLKVPLQQLICTDEDNFLSKETKLLDKFRMLNEEDQNLILQTIELVIYNNYELSESHKEEVELLDNFRHLNEDGQKYILQTMKMAAGTYRKKNDIQKRDA